MGQFKPMVKMMTTEPTVELKLKSGGKVEKKMQMGGTPAMAPAMGGLPARGGEMMAAAPGRPDMMKRRRMMKAMGAGPSGPVGRAARMMKDGGESKSEHSAEMKKMSGTAEDLKEHKSMPASKAHKGLKTGGVANGQGGYMHGGKIKKYAKGGGVEGNVSTSHAGVSNTKTGEVVKGQGGYKKGGKAKKMAMGGMSQMPITPRVANPVSRPLTPRVANPVSRPLTPRVENPVSKPPPTQTMTSRIGTAMAKPTAPYKKGGATKKFARGGSVNDSGKAEDMPQGRKKPAAPVSINRLSGTYKKGGSVKMMEGGPADIEDEKKRRAMNKAYEESGKVSSELEDAMNPLSMIKEAFGKAKKMFKREPSSDSVTKTKESVTVTPLKKRQGGAC